MRVLIASHSAGLRGGAERCVLELATGLHRDGRVEPTVTVPARGELSGALDGVGVAWRVAPTPTWLVDEPAPWPQDPFRAGRRAKRAVRSWTSASAWSATLRDVGPDVVLSSTTTSPTAAFASRRARIPHVWWVHEFTTLDHHKRYALGEGVSQRLMGRLSRRLAVNSRAVARHYAPPIASEKVQVVDLGVEPMEVGPNVVIADRLRVLLLGRQAPAKGCEVAIRALAAIREETVDVTLRMVGPSIPGYAEKLWYLARDLDVLDRIEFLEFVSDPLDQFEWCNVLLMGSESEAFGRVTIEALKSGRPVIGARAAGTIELIDDGCDGVLFAPGDVDGLATAFLRCARDAALVERMSKDAVARMAGRFTIEDEVDAFVELLHEVTR